MSEKIPCPVDGCDEEFADESEAMTHTKEKHRDDFAPPPMQIIPPGEPPEDQVQAVEKETPTSTGDEEGQSDSGGHESPIVQPEQSPDKEDVLAMVPPGMLKVLDERVEKIVEAKIEAALEAYLPQVQAAVGGAMEKAIDDKARAAGIILPSVSGGGGAPGTPVTPVGQALLAWITKGGGGGSSDMENLAKTLTQARAISDVLNPPSIWDRVMQNAVLRSLGKPGLVTDTEVKELLTPPAKP